MSDVDVVSLVNEYHRLQRQLESKTQQLESLLSVNAEAGAFPTDFDKALNRRYSIEFQYAAGDTGNGEGLQPQERSVNVENGTIFRCAYIETFLRGVGSQLDAFSGESVTVQATLPWNIRVVAFDFLWRVRDTGTDREWVDQPQPSLFAGGGYYGPLWLPRRVILGGGTAIYATIEPTINQQSVSGFFQDGDIQQWIVQMSFVGHEVPDGSAL